MNVATYVLITIMIILFFVLGLVIGSNISSNRAYIQGQLDYSNGIIKIEPVVDTSWIKSKWGLRMKEIIIIIGIGAMFTSFLLVLLNMEASSGDCCENAYIQGQLDYSKGIIKIEPVVDTSWIKSK